MAVLPRGAAAVSLLTGAWAVVAAWGLGPMYECPRGGCPIPALQSATPALGILLVIVALVCFVGIRSAFAAGGVLSAAIAAVTLFDLGGRYGGWVWATLVVLSAASVVLDVLAVSRRAQLKEQANPMNLPVFG